MSKRAATAAWRLFWPALLALAMLAAMITGGRQVLPHAARQAQTSPGHLRQPDPQP